MAKKEVALRCYEMVSVSDTISKTEDIYSDFVQFLRSTKKVEDRVIHFTDAEQEGESDCVSYFEEIEDTVFCFMFRAHAGAPITIDSDFLNKPSFTPEQMLDESDEKTLGFIKAHTYILMNKHFIVFRSGQFKAEDISIYIRQSLKKTPKYAKKEVLFTIKPSLKSGFDRSRIKSLELKSGYRLNEKSAVSSFVTKIESQLLNSVLDAKDIAKIKPENIIEASVILRFKKPETTTEEDVLRSFLGAVNTDDAIVRDKRNQTINPDEILLKSHPRINFLENNYPDRADILYEMQALLHEAIDDKKKRV
jgi:hypothetical protein